MALDDLGPTALVSPPVRVRTDGWAPPDMVMYTSRTGNVSRLWQARYRRAVSSYGTGRAYRDPETARTLAVGETLERYSMLFYDEREFVVEEQRELDSAMDLDTVPRCSTRELSHPYCPLVLADNAAVIRWVEGVELTSRERCLVPAVMAYLVAEPWASETFIWAISTGAAAHVTAEQALVAAICEVIERDMIALTWLQRLPLAPLAEECIPDEARVMMEWARQHGISTHLFDATSDIGIPIVYCLQTCDSTDRAAQLVGCAADFQVETAVTKALMECLGARAAVYSFAHAPRRYADYATVLQGAIAMGRPARRRAFHFLLDGVAEKPRSRPENVPASTPSEKLEHLIATFAAREMPVYAVDVTSPDVAERGVVVVRAVIPALQPMSLHPLVQYRAHPRLYDGPARLGFPALPESRQNRWPQPMG